MIDEWAEVASKSVKLVAVEMGFSSCEAKGRASGLPKNLAGAFVPLVGQNASVQLGLMATKAGQELLARTVLQMEPDEELEREDVTDAVGELTNCLVGRIKREMRTVDPTLKIGLPVFIEGTVEDIGKSEHCTIEVLMNGTPVSVVVVVGA